MKLLTLEESIKELGGKYWFVKSFGVDFKNHECLYEKTDYTDLYLSGCKSVLNRKVKTFFKDNNGMIVFVLNGNKLY